MASKARTFSSLYPVRATMEMALAGEAPRGNGSVMGHQKIGSSASFFARMAEAAVERWLPEPFPQQVRMLEDRGAVVHGIVGRNLVGLTSRERRRERRITQKKDRPIPRRGCGIVVDRSAYSDPSVEIGSVAVAPASREQGRTAPLSAQRGCRGRAQCPRSIRSAPEFQPGRRIWKASALQSGGPGAAKDHFTIVVAVLQRAEQRRHVGRAVFHRDDNAEPRFHQ